MHGVSIPDTELAMFRAWSIQDPVSPWEKTRHDRIKAVQGNANPFVDGITPDNSGECSWE
jgi:deoxyribonuclease-1